MSVINLKAAGAITNGYIICRLDFSATSTADLSIVKSASGTYCAFVKQNTAPWKRLSKELIEGSGWMDASNGDISVISKAIYPYCLSELNGAGIDYVENTTETGLYFDGINKITTAPAKVLTADEKIAALLSGTDGTTPAPDTTKWYQKPVNIVIGLGVLVGLGFLVKKFM